MTKAAGFSVLVFKRLDIPSELNLFPLVITKCMFVGAWNEDGKAPSIWDTFSHTEGKIEDQTNGDVACDSYRNYQQDVKLMKVKKCMIYTAPIH